MNETVFPFEWTVTEHDDVGPIQTRYRHAGLTKRELFAAVSLHGVLSSTFGYDVEDLAKGDPRLGRVRLAVRYADALINELKEEKKS